MDPGSRGSWRWWHSAVVAAALLLASAQAVLTPSWCDEVAYVDPGAQLALTGRMVSTAWLTNSPETLWGSSNPGMPLLFAGWFKLAGFGQLQARMLFCLLHFAGVWCLFRWVRRRLNPKPWPSVLGITSSLLLPSLGNAVFQPRLECVAFLLCAWFLYYTYEDKRCLFLDWAAAPALGIIIMFFGLHFAGFFALAALCAFLIAPGRRTFFLGVGLALGLLAGMAILRAAYVRAGVWETFVAARACHYGRVLDWVPVGWRRFSATGDLPWIAVLAGIGLVSTMTRNGRSPTPNRKPWLWAIGVFGFVPLLIGTIGIYYGNYSWMVALPMMLCFYFGAPGLDGKWRTAFVSILILVLAVVSFRFAQRLPGLAREAVRRQQVTAALARILPERGAVAADFPLYYQLVAAGYRVYPRVKADEGLCLGFEQDHFLPKLVRGQITCVVTKKQDAAAILSGLGGEWRMSEEIPAVSARQPQDDLQIFVRK